MRVGIVWGVEPGHPDWEGRSCPLRKPVWALIPCDADWRWLREREDSPWYPTMRLFRQEERGRWEPVMERVVAALHAMRG